MRSIRFLVLLVLASPALAQDGHHTHQPYRGMEAREIKALSAKEVDDLKAGRGMGLALAAELNGHPGPLHVLEHAAALGLTPDQIAASRKIQSDMATKAKAIGADLIRAEHRLDQAFAQGRITEPLLAALTAEIGVLQGRLRAAHLAAHVEQRALLTEGQIAAYARLRGYAGG
ncbi:MAG: hypothetical protein FJX47_01455 [Alphaproteobacteria bacterium]|nr:hypothetical protein [Alphaproteobacteria bacterium]